MTSTQPTLTQRGSAFTLIELLVVIAVIALLAGLIVGMGAGATQSRKEKLIETQLETLVTVLESYKKKHGFYPPSVINAPALAGNNGLAFASPNLFYEVTGAEVVDSNGDGQPEGFTPSDGQETVSVAEMAAYGFNGLINTGDSPRAVKNFYPGLMPSQVEADPAPPGGGKAIRFLVVPAERAPGEKFNPWRYNSANPTNNPQSFDLWAEFVIGKKARIIGNWAQ